MISQRKTTPAVKRKSGKAVNSSHGFGGRATARGVAYEFRIAALIATRMLAGDRCAAWSGISGADIAAITMQSPEPVDDVVVSLRGKPEGFVFISAKDRASTIPLTAKSPAFADTVDAFVRQYLRLPAVARAKSRLVWAVPSSAGISVTRDLAVVLDTLRDDDGSRLSGFLRGRQVRERKAITALMAQVKRVWKKQSGKLPSSDELHDFLRVIHVEVYEFEFGQRHDRQAESEIRTHIVVDPKQSKRAWEMLERFFERADQRGVRVTASSLRRALVADGLKLKSPPDYADDIALMGALTARNMSRLRDHTVLRFGAKTEDEVHIARPEELSALITAVKAGPLLITGEPGCGKSGIVHPLVEALQKEGFPVVLLLAEDNLPSLTHTLDEILANWPDGSRGFLVTDALDAVRDVEPQRAIRQLLRGVQEGQSGWTVIASVREFDLKHSGELRATFPGAGMMGYSSCDFASVAHFHLSRLSEAQLDDLARKRPDIYPFIENARKSPKSAEIHRSPFHLRLAAELLDAGVPSTRLADWHNPALLMRKFWEFRIREGAGAAEREVVLKALCRRMLDTRNMVVSLKQLPLSASDRSQVDELRSRGILQSPAVRLGMQVGGDEIRFTHHLLHDYAIARALIPETPVLFRDFAIQEPLLPIFYRQSFMFGLEELWDAPDGREAFWEATLMLESVPRLHGIARTIAPVLATRRVEFPADLEPLLIAVTSADAAASPAQKALRHLASGVHDADPKAIRTGAKGWCTFTEHLANLLPRNGSIEQPLALIVDRLNAVNAATIPGECHALNAAARGLLAHHVAKEVSKGWRYASRVATEVLCRTFTVAPVQTERALLGLFAPDRLAHFPHDDLFDLAQSIKHLGTDAADPVVFRLFEAAFESEPEPGQYEDKGSAILSLRFQTSDSWTIIRHALADYYQGRTGGNAAFMTEAVCIAWNSVVRRRSDRQGRDNRVLATIHFRGVACELVEDCSHVWGRQFENDENRILAHFEKLLREWAAGNDTARLTLALDLLALRNRTSLLWMVLMEVGAEYPSTPGVLLEELLSESSFLTHQDYVYGATALLSALHKLGDTARRERLERLILDVPRNARLHEGEPREPTPSWVEYAQNRLLNALDESNIVLGIVRDSLRERRCAKTLPENRKPTGPQVSSHTFSDKELVEQRGINLKEAPNEAMFRLREALKPFLGRDQKQIDEKEVERNWDVIQKCERALRGHAKQHPKMAEELWGYLVGACENIVGNVTSWPKSSGRWKTIRRILLKAATDRSPAPDDDADTKDEGWPSWGWPAPRLDAARGLTFLTCRLGFADQQVASALRRLCRDKSHPLRFNLADRIAVLEQPAPDLAWELIDTFISNENRFSVLDALLLSMDRRQLWERAPGKAMPRLKQISDRAHQHAPEGNHIHETLGHIHLFHFLRTGEESGESFVTHLISECDSKRASHTLGALLHACRGGGCLTAGDGVTPDAQADVVRARTWGFFCKLLAAAQAKLTGHRNAWRELVPLGQTETEAAKLVREKLDRVAHLVDDIAMQLYFACGAFDEKNKKDKERLTSKSCRFWREASPLFAALTAEPHPHTAHQIVETLAYLLPCAPRDVFLLATQSIRKSATEAGYQYDPLAGEGVVKLIQHALADHREIFQADHGQESDCLVALLEVLDLFVEAGWAEARQLTHRLEEIYR